MNHIESKNNRNESHIEFVSDDSSKYRAIDDFYNATIMKLWEGWDSEENAIRYIKNAEKRKRTIEDLNHEISECMKITPIAKFNPNTKDASEIYSFYDEWNNKEFLWKCDGLFWLISWGTAA